MNYAGAVSPETSLSINEGVPRTLVFVLLSHNEHSLR